MKRRPKPQTSVAKPPYPKSPPKIANGDGVMSLPESCLHSLHDQIKIMYRFFHFCNRPVSLGACRRCPCPEARADYVDLCKFGLVARQTAGRESSAGSLCLRP